MISNYVLYQTTFHNFITSSKGLKFVRLGYKETGCQGPNMELRCDKSMMAIHGHDG